VAKAGTAFDPLRGSLAGGAGLGLGAGLWAIRSIARLNVLRHSGSERASEGRAPAEERSLKLVSRKSSSSSSFSLRLPRLGIGVGAASHVRGALYRAPSGARIYSRSLDCSRYWDPFSSVFRSLYVAVVSLQAPHRYQSPPWTTVYAGLVIIWAWWRVRTRLAMRALVLRR